MVTNRIRNQFGKKYEAAIVRKLQLIPNIWVYHFPGYDRTQWKSPPGDVLITSPWYNILVEIKTTKNKSMPKGNVNVNQVDHLQYFDRLENHHSFVYVTFTTMNKHYLIPISEFNKIPGKTLNIKVCDEYGIATSLLSYIRKLNNGRYKI